MIRQLLGRAGVRINTSQAPNPGDRLVIRLNKNANMSRGKYAAQAVHAALTLLGVHPGCPVIVLGASPDDLEAMDVQVRDAGLTEVERGTLTAAAAFEPERDA